MEALETAKPAEMSLEKPPPFVASQSGAVEKAPTANEEEQLRALFNDAHARGLDEKEMMVNVPKAQANGPEQPPVPPTPAPASIPQKFMKPDGTVDEDKLKASSERLNEVVEQKQKTVDELLLEYQEREKKLHSLGQQKAEIQAQMPPVPPPVPVQQQSDPQQLQQRIMQDYQQNPLDTTIKLAEAIAATKVAPILQRFEQDEEQRRLAGMRQNVANLAQSDPRFLDPRLNAMVNQVLDEDPQMMRLKNPHKAAWNEVKERLRLGEPNQVQAQPSNAMPTLARGAPPSVSTLSGPLSPQSARQVSQQVSPYSPEGKAFEEQLKELTKDVWQY
ncbi:MAG TPA: hypothetical protein VNV63_00905 [Nitrospiria bacterium]|jgi:hypothetical protein|nr:hypothetical protein [Nitrospiria bacterium]